MKPEACLAMRAMRAGGVVGATMKTLASPCFRDAAMRSPASYGGQSSTSSPSAPASRTLRQ